MAAIVCKLVFWNRLQSTSNPIDVVLNVWTVIITTQIIQGLEIFSTCCLNLPPFLEGTRSGFMHADDLRRRGQSYADIFGYVTQKVSNGDNGNHSMTAGGRGQGIPQLPRIPHISGTHHKVYIKGGKGDVGWDAGSQHSQSQIIKQTRSFTVNHGRLDAPLASRSDEEMTPALDCQ